MARPPRYDSPEKYLHVTDRGLAKKPVFETREDIRFFLSLLARAVRRGDFEIHAYCVLMTHFHLLVRSRNRRLSKGLGWVLNQYTRYYNRTRRRDGPIWRGRFYSRPVRSYRHQCVLVRYIHDNPLGPRLASVATEYPYSSAYWYARARRPRWLECSWVDREAGGRTGQRLTAPEAFLRTFGVLRPEERDLVEAARQRRPPIDETVDDLVAAQPAEVLAWMQRKAALGDGCAPGSPVIDAGSVMAVLGESQATFPVWRLRVRHKYLPAWDVLRIALLRHLSGLSYTEISTRVECSTSAVRSRLLAHAQFMVHEEDYCRKATECASRAVERCHGSRVRGRKGTDDR